MTAFVLFLLLDLDSAAMCGAFSIQLLAIIQLARVVLEMTHAL